MMFVVRAELRGFDKVFYDLCIMFNAFAAMNMYHSVDNPWRWIGWLNIAALVLLLVARRRDY